MHIGKFEIELLSEGIFEVFEDGVFRKIDALNITANTTATGETEYAAMVGINPVMVRSGKQVILLDTGLGWGLDKNSSYKDTSNLLTNLDIFGVRPEDVTHVVLSHLHFDHAAGSTYVDDETSTQPTFPNAHYFLQKKEWYYALSQLEQKKKKAGAGYEMDELYKLAAEDRLVLITDTYYKLFDGIELIRTGGHTPGHQIVKIQDAGESAYFLGDLIPSEHQLNHYAMKNLDLDPVQAKKAKTLILRQALEEEACLLFYHSIHAKAGKLHRNEDRKFVIKDVV